MSKSLRTVILMVFWVGFSAHSFAFTVPEGTDFNLYRDRPQANDFKMSSVAGTIFGLGDLKGKVVLLNFWRKDCFYCDAEKKHLHNMVRHIPAKELVVLCVNLWDTPAVVQAVAKDNADFTFASKVDGQRAVVQNIVKGRLMGYFVLNNSNEAIYEIKGFPSTYVIDREGRVIASHLGMAQWNSPGIRKWISGLIGDGNRISGTGERPVPVWLDNLPAGPGKRL